MAVPEQLACPNCGSLNPASAPRCSRCGTEFVVGGRPAWPPQDASDIRKVKLGVLLGLIGIPLGWLLGLGVILLPPGAWAAGWAGVGLASLGAVLVFAGRRPFEYSLGGKAIVALFLVPLAAGAAFLAMLFLFARAVEFAASGLPFDVAWMFKAMILWAFLIPTLSVLGSLLLVYDLQDRTGTILSFVGVLAFVGAGLAGLALGWPRIDSVAADPLVAADPTSEGFLGPIVSALYLAWVADLGWRAVFAVVYARTFRRLARGEIPAPAEAEAPPPVPVPGTG